MVKGHDQNRYEKQLADNSYDHRDYSTGHAGYHRVRSRRQTKKASHKAARQAANKELASYLN